MPASLVRQPFLPLGWDAELLQTRLIGVKSYPRGVTTNSDGGIESYETYYPVFETMEEVGMVLNLHGEVPSDTSTVRLLQSRKEHVTQITCYLHRTLAF